MSIQDFVVSVVRFTADRPGAVTVIDAVGTAFFIDEQGTFLTAGSALLSSTPGSSLGLAVRMRDSRAQFSVVPVVAREFADPPWDVAIGQADVATRRSFFLGNVEASPLIWVPITTYGCVALERPATDRAPVPVFRAVTGNVMREVAGDGARSAPILESSFAVTSQMRGAPVFVAERPRARLVGLCVGNGSLGDLVYPSPDGTDDIRPDRHGIAQDLRALAHWRPRLLHGASLRAAFDD